MFNKLATFTSGIFAAVKQIGIQIVAIPSSFVQHVSAIFHDALVGTMNHLIAVVKAVHTFVASVTNHLTLLFTPAPKPIVVPPPAQPAEVTKQTKSA